MTTKDLVNAINRNNFISTTDLKRTLGKSIKSIIELSCEWLGEKFSISEYKVELNDGGHAFVKCMSSNFDEWTEETVGYMVASMAPFK